MSDYAISYDLSVGHKAFLTAAEKEGLLYVWKGATYVNRLPNTTIWGLFTSGTEANNAFDRALSKASTAIGQKIKMEKRLTTAMSSSFVNSDRRKEPEARWTGNTSFETSRLHQVNDPYFK
jgi:hypothetical protein